MLESGQVYNLAFQPLDLCITRIGLGLFGFLCIQVGTALDE